MKRIDASSGVVFPVVDATRSSSATGREIIAAATREVDTAASTNAASEEHWRQRYLEHFHTLTRLEAQQHALRIAQYGLAAVHERFGFEREGDTIALDVAAKLPDVSGLELQTGRVRGAAAPERQQLSVPYRGARLAGGDLRGQLDHWVDAGTVEPSFAAALNLLQDNPDWLDLSDLTVVVLGASAEMGPLISLLRWGAHVVAVDLPDPARWANLIAIARRCPGTLSMPLRRPVRRPAGGPIGVADAANARGVFSSEADDAELAANAGADLVTDLPEIAAWLRTIEGPFTLGSYVYADGPDHVRVSVAVDALTQSLLADRNDIALSFLLTPTDTYAVPVDVVEFSRARFRERSSWSVAAHGLSAGRVFSAQYREITTNNDGERLGLCDALVEQQGPNYALAKRIQRWRATAARLHGGVVSTNVAPATRTRSVVRNRLLAAAYAGAPRFGLEVFNPSTSNTVMAAMLVHDLRNDRSSAQPLVPLLQPYRLFVDGAAHGGMWRSGYSPRSVLAAAAVLGMVTRS